MVEAKPVTGRLSSAAPIEEGISLFIDSLRLSGRACSTLIAYSTDLKQFALFVHTRLAVVSIESISAGLVREFIEDRAKRYSLATLRRKLAAIASLFRFLREEKIWDGDPTSRIHIDMELNGSSLHSGYDEISQLLDNTEVSDFISSRNRAIVEIIYGGGLRLNELVSLNLTSLDLLTVTFHVGSLARLRRVPIGKRAAAAVKEYLLFRADLLIDKPIADIDVGAFFLNTMGKRLHRRTVQRVVARFLDEVDSSIGPQVLRRFCATHMIEGGASVEGVAKLFGQKTIELAFHESTEAELVDRLRSSYAASHPRSK